MALVIKRNNEVAAREERVRKIMDSMGELVNGNKEKELLKKLEKERREQFERLKKESEALEAEVGALRDKVAASSSRSKVKARRYSKRISSVVLLFYCLLEQFCEV